MFRGINSFIADLDASIQSALKIFGNFLAKPIPKYPLPHPTSATIPPILDLK